MGNRTLAAVAGLVMTSVAIAEPLTIPPNGTDAILAGSLKVDAQAKALGTGGTQQGLLVDGMTVLRVSADGTAGAPYNVAIRYPSTLRIQNGDVLLLAVEARTVDAKTETGDGQLTIVGQLAREPWTRLGGGDVSPTRDWMSVYTPMTATRDYAAGEAQFGFDFGYRPQTIELRNLRVVHYGKTLTAKDLPRTPTTYPGREPNAPWRAAAAERIEKHRKGDLSVTVVDAAGNPIPGAKVHANQVSHAFGFGTCVVADALTATDEGSQQYRDVLSRYFNYAVFENDLKWTVVEKSDPQQQQLHRTKVRQSIRWLLENGFRVRGHCLVWPGADNNHFMPADMRDMVKAQDAQGLRDRAASHIADVAGEFAGLLTDWDVINEPVSNHAVQDVTGREVMIDWFKQARAADPVARLFLNDYTMLSGGATQQKNIDAFYDNVKFLVDGGAPIGGIGEQAHFGSSVTAPGRVVSILDRFAQFGLPIQITEFDVNSDDEDFQADYIRDFYTAAFSHPAVDSILMWGFWQNRHWLPSAAIFRSDWTTKKGADVYIDLVTKKWRTEQSLETDARGTASLRGFKGDYELTVVLPDGTVRTARTRIGDDPVKVDLAD